MNASKIIIKKKIIARREIVAPAEETRFQVVNESGKSEYRRGIPARPRKCWGKKVKFTPTNMI